MLKLSSTSALVLLWVQEKSYQTTSAIAYLSQLNLDEGKYLFEECNKVFEYSEVIKNRKYGVIKLIKKHFAENGNETQVVIAGAGFDALGIELVNLYKHLKVFELDRDNMAVKSTMVEGLNDGISDRIKFIDADLINTNLVHEKLVSNGWDSSKPTLLVLEGISYYLTSKSIQDLHQIIQPNAIVFEYLKMDKNISPQRLKIPQTVFGLISKVCELPFINTFDKAKTHRIFNDYSISKRLSMTQLEKLRTESNTFFSLDDDGWIEVCLLKKITT